MVLTRTHFLLVLAVIFALLSPVDVRVLSRSGGEFKGHSFSPVSHHSLREPLVRLIQGMDAASPGKEDAEKGWEEDGEEGWALKGATACTSRC
ncbi:hypothetical protein NDU88_001856 [Pleurodeles waltl]|uniref:Uncharacterized protein n=1 Tax=Pleurodeles waltl TaxID=8319 RepID=A0AAV7MMP5_PLEWA|nr:hypothetical protein NDU88_001856 [Pleurodeles waltl]